MSRLSLKLAIAASLLSLAAGFSASAIADDEAAAQQPAPATAKPAEATKQDVGYECHEEEKTGSHFSRRVCTTAEQRRKEREAAGRMLQRAGNQSGQLNPGGN